MPDEFFVNIYASVPDGSITRFKPGPEGNFYFRFGIDYDAMSGSWVADPLPTPWQVGFIPPGGDATDVVPVEAELTVEEPLACPPPEPAGNVDPYPYIRGELRITGPGWTIEGPFLAPYCLHLSG